MHNTSERIRCFLFSFNLGPEIENCMRSLDGSNLPLTIIDDGTTDKKAQDILRKARATCEVIDSKDLGLDPLTGEKRTGGLYGNMNMAMQMAKERGLQYVIFIQDDMQFVRDVTSRDIDLFDEYFSNNNSIVLNPCFLKAAFRRWDINRMRLASCESVYERRPVGPGRFYFSAVGVFSVKNFNDLYKEFEPGERKNEIKSKQIGLSMGFFRFPFMAWLPYPRSRATKEKSWGDQIVERVGGAGSHFIEMMSSADVEKLFGSDSGCLPFAEDYLNAPTAPNQKVWSPESGTMNLICRGGWRKSLGVGLNRLGIGRR